MLPLHYRSVLIDASKFGEEGSPERLARIEAVTERIRGLVPQFFYIGDHDPAMKDRVFHHKPFSLHWSGSANTTHTAYVADDAFHGFSGRFR